MNKTFDVRPEYLSRVENIVNRLNRRAVKLNVEPVSYQVTAPELRPVKSREETHYVNFVTVSLSLNIPKLSGWEFVCTIQHLEGGNLLNTVPRNDEAAPLDLSAFRSCPPSCCHCSLERNRVDTYVVRSESGELKQVGKNCLASFTGYGTTPESAAALAQWLSALAELLETGGSDDRDGGEEGCGVSRDGVGLDEYLAHVVAVSNKVGFRTRKVADQLGTSSTAEDAIFNLEPPKDSDRSKLVTVSDEDRVFAKSARAWAAGLVAASDFDHNLKMVASSDGVLYRNLGLAAYLVEAYRKQISAARAPRTESKHFGAVKDRMKGLRLTYRGNASFDSQFGVTFIHRFTTEDGSDAVWKTGTVDGSGFDIGTIYTVDATVKRHGDYKGRLQTELTRVKVTNE